ncbi:tRNA-uridine aminocarboxypropyltransferase [Thalassotalea ganghwensis]
MHAVHQLYLSRKSISTKPFKGRGYKVERCERCHVAAKNCICQWRKQVNSNVGFLVLMYDKEVLKPSNTGKLIADVIPDVMAYTWSRTEENQDIISIIKDEKWQPFVVFPKEYADSERIFVNSTPKLSANKRPLFIMLDGSWREARKMFRKSSYLSHLPVLSIDLSTMLEQANSSQYHIRKSHHDSYLATAEVAALVLKIAGEEYNGKVLTAWFNVFTYYYQKSVCRSNQGDPQALAKFLALEG